MGRQTYSCRSGRPLGNRFPAAARNDTANVTDIAIPKRPDAAPHCSVTHRCAIKSGDFARFGAALMPDKTRLHRRKAMLLSHECRFGKSAAMHGKATCGARTRQGTPCRCLGLKNGRCKLHGGLSTGPKTPEGWARVRAGHAAYLASQNAKAGTTPSSINSEF